MKQTEFVLLYYPHARETESKTGISSIAILAQAALESAWGKAAPGNMFFGIKDTDGKNGNEQLLITTEYSRRNDLKFPEIISITPVVRSEQKWYKYVVKDYFRKYNTAEESFTEHAMFFLRNNRYATALTFRKDPYQFIDAVAKAGYATDPSYAETLKSVARRIASILKQQKLLSPKESL